MVRVLIYQNWKRKTTIQTRCKFLFYRVPAHNGVLIVCVAVGRYRLHAATPLFNNRFYVGYIIFFFSKLRMYNNNNWFQLHAFPTVINNNTRMAFGMLYQYRIYREVHTLLSVNNVFTDQLCAFNCLEKCCNALFCAAFFFPTLRPLLFVRE